MRTITLADELLLLAYDDGTGRSTVPHIALDLGLAAAVLIDLALYGRLVVTDRSVVPVDPTPVGHPVADEILARIAGEQPKPVASWLQRLRHRLRERVLSGLVARGVVRDQDEAVWQGIHVHRYPTVDSASEQDIRARLATTLTGEPAPDEWTAALATLVAAVRMEPTLGLSGEAVVRAHRRLGEIASSAGFAADIMLEESTARPSVAFVVGELCRAVLTALGPEGQTSKADGSGRKAEPPG